MRLVRRASGERGDRRRQGEGSQRKFEMAKEKKGGVVKKALRDNKARARNIPLPAFSIDTEGPDAGLQLGLVPAGWEEECIA